MYSTSKRLKSLNTMEPMCLGCYLKLKAYHSSGVPYRSIPLAMAPSGRARNVRILHSHLDSQHIPTCIASASLSYLALLI